MRGDEWLLSEGLRRGIDTPGGRAYNAVRGEAVQFWGHSQSECPPGQGRVEEDVYDLSPAHIAGDSFGATIVLRLALTHPVLFRTMVIHESDPEGQRLLAQATGGVSAALPNCEQKTITGAGHVPQLTHPEQYVEMVTAFLAGQG